jgi:hypothetical protein
MSEVRTVDDVEKASPSEPKRPRWWQWVQLLVAVTGLALQALRYWHSD